MTGTQTSACAWMLTGCLSLLALSPYWQPAQAQSPEQIPFRIDAGTLGPALHAYGRATGIAVMLDDRYSDRPVQAVAGSYTASAAMQRLLSGTGLLARFIGGDAVIVYAPQGASGSSAAQAPTTPQTSYGDYVARLQTAVTQALCRQSQTRPGRYRLALQMRLDGMGQVAGLRLLDSTGDSARDQAVASSLRALSFAPPPPAMPQPVLLLLVPDGPGAVTRCPPSSRTEH